MLRIIQVFNNNVALVSIDKERQAVVKGRGIAFKKKHGDEIFPQQVDKFFVLDTETSRQNLQFLLKDIPIDIVTTTYEIIEMAKQEYDLKVLDYIYITLSDHIFGAYQRLRTGQYKDTLVPDFHQQYPIEYEVAEQSIKVIDRNLEANFPNSEVKNLALHFVNAVGEEPGVQPLEGKNEAKINAIVKSTLKRHGVLRSTSNHNYFDRFMIHLQYLVDRLPTMGTNAPNLVPQVTSELKQSYPLSYQIGTEIFQNLHAEGYTQLNQDELLYFIIHIQRLIDERPIHPLQEGK